MTLSNITKKHTQPLSVHDNGTVGVSAVTFWRQNNIRGEETLSTEMLATPSTTGTTTLSSTSLLGAFCLVCLLLPILQNTDRIYQQDTV